MIDQARVRTARNCARQELLARRTTAGCWTGELSSSALSSATAVCALSIAQSGPAGSAAINQGLAWLANHANADGGWGDTVASISNVSTTTLVWAAFGSVPGADGKFPSAVKGAERWLTGHAGGCDPAHLVPAIVRRYGRDRTFSVPILTMCALAGRLGTGPQAWSHVLPLPFELAALPHTWFATLRLPVVSYALPALIAIGQARHHHLPSRNPLARGLRNATRERTLKVLQAIQPASGGFLEATPLTSFVTMSLAASGQAGHEVTRKGVAFLLASMRPDGSWPIDTNLATWVTTLSVNALPAGSLTSVETERIHTWLLGQQYRTVHPYTNAPPGGWAWTDLTGGVPDADDTAGALVALHRLGTIDDRTRAAAAAGVTWLLDLQNRDGGIPTFCRGWGALPFDRSSPDLTAHALRAWSTWQSELPAALRSRIQRSQAGAIAYLARTQTADGAWIPLWFGNQHAPDDVNPTYGTARVLQGLQALTATNQVPANVATLQAKGVEWLLRAQGRDGGWSGFAGGTPSVEETALAIDALAECRSDQRDRVAVALDLGTDWLVRQVESQTWKEPSPIGFYFAKLWYFEQLYPLIFTIGALEKVAAPR
jgi:squalene-hopene/tetraprenyl-beta-curcumene cyclase